VREDAVDDAAAAAHVLQAGEDLLVRLHRPALPLLDAANRQFNPLHLFRPLRVGHIQEWRTRTPGTDGRWIRGRLLAVRRSALYPSHPRFFRKCSF